MPGRCQVIDCKSFCDGYYTSPKISLHKFPDSVTMRKVWLRMISRVDFVPHKNSHVCSLHFRDKDIQKETTDKKGWRVKGRATKKLLCHRLKKNAIPCLRMGVPLTDVLPMEPTNKKNVRREILGTQERVENVSVGNTEVPAAQVAVESETGPIETDDDVVVLEVIKAEEKHIQKQAAAIVKSETGPIETDDDVVVLEVIKAEQKHMQKEAAAIARQQTQMPKTEAGVIEAHVRPEQGTPDLNDNREFDSTFQTIMNGVKKGEFSPSAAASSVFWLQKKRHSCDEKYREEMAANASGPQVINRLTQLSDMDRKIGRLKNAILEAKNC